MLAGLRKVLTNAAIDAKTWISLGAAVVSVLAYIRSGESITVARDSADTAKRALSQNIANATPHLVMHYQYSDPKFDRVEYFIDNQTASSAHVTDIFVGVNHKFNHFGLLDRPRRDMKPTLNEWSTEIMSDVSNYIKDDSISILGRYGLTYPGFWMKGGQSFEVYDLTLSKEVSFEDLHKTGDILASVPISWRYCNSDDTICANTNSFSVRGQPCTFD